MWTAALCVLLAAPDAGASPPERFTDLAGKRDARFEGTVSKVTEQGALIDLDEGGVGLLHNDDGAWAPPKSAKDFLKVGQRVTVSVQRVDSQTRRVTLTTAPPGESPWLKVGERYKIGGRYRGKVVKVMGHGVFFALEPGVELLVPRSGLPRGKAPTDFKVGMEADLTLSSVDADKKRISGAVQN
jgi:small subunit ribosomal protein S1